MSLLVRPARALEAVPVGEIPRLAVGSFRDQVRQAVADGARVAAFFGAPNDRLPSAADAPTSGRPVRLFAVLARDEQSSLELCSTDLDGSFPSLTPEVPQLHLFERELAEQFSVAVKGHPWLKPVRFPSPLVAGEGSFFRLQGEEAHEVAVGPVHAGIIEPGHFRFQCHGEVVHHLEISLGYQHRGIERALVGGPDKRTLHYMETAAGDTTTGHAVAYARVVDALAGVEVPPRAYVLRGMALELERVANHTGDLGALAGDVGYLPTQSFCGRIRGDFLNMTALLCGNRFGRGMVVPGGVAFDVDDDRAADLARRLEDAARDAKGAIDLMFDTPSVVARFRNTGRLTAGQCRDVGVVGVAARAAGLARDVRRDFPFGAYAHFPFPVSTADTGDVYGRALVRWLEMRRSMDYVRARVGTLPAGEVRVPTAPLRPWRLVVSLVEGWRGEVCHVGITDAGGRLAHYKVVDPSFHNWFGLALALRGQQISDFPLCNKSFNLSYCGHDL